MARYQEAGGMIGPPRWDYSNKAYVKKALEDQNNSRRRTPVYFSEWHNTGEWMKKDQKLKSRLHREAMRVLSDLQNELRGYGEWDGAGRKAAAKLHLSLANPDGRYKDRPFIHIIERGPSSESLFAQINFRSGFSDSAWKRYLSKRNAFEAEAGKGSYPRGDQTLMDSTSIRDKVLKRYFDRNPYAYKYGKL